MHIVKSFMDGLARTKCQIYVNATEVGVGVSERGANATCVYCLEGKINPLLDGEVGVS